MSAVYDRDRIASPVTDKPKLPIEPAVAYELARTLRRLDRLNTELQRLRLRVGDLIDIAVSPPLPPIKVAVIQAEVARYFDIELIDMLSMRRGVSMLARHVAIYLCRTLTVRSLPDIARRFDRDHSSVMHAIERIENLRATDRNMERKIEELKQLLCNSGAEK